MFFFCINIPSLWWLYTLDSVEFHWSFPYFYVFIRTHHIFRTDRTNQSFMASTECIKLSSFEWFLFGRKKKYAITRIYLRTEINNNESYSYIRHSARCDSENFEIIDIIFYLFINILFTNVKIGRIFIAPFADLSRYKN